jgi:hypothetical protein|tara:strand:- start:8749 stop:9123 length:375 start_codon:yes stop_codon:yes gene_type:complete
MVQELGETTQEMIKADDQAVQDILNARPTGHYWIVIHHRPAKVKMDTGEYVLIRLVKDYDTRPKQMLGTIILEVKEGAIVSERINVHDMPIDEERLAPHLGLIGTPTVQTGRRDIASAYAYNTL